MNVHHASIREVDQLMLPTSLDMRNTRAAKRLQGCPTGSSAQGRMQ
jgi:hypothetical protein